MNLHSNRNIFQVQPIRCKIPFFVLLLVSCIFLTKNSHAQMQGLMNRVTGAANGGGRPNCGGAMGIVEAIGGGAVVVVVGGGPSAGGGRRGGGAGLSVASIFSREIIGLRTANASDLSFSATVELDDDSRVGTVLLDSVDELGSTFRRQHRR
jgi:hypothetical protein